MVLAACALLWGQSDGQKALTARELFYAAVQQPAAPKTVKPVKKKQAGRTAQARPPAPPPVSRTAASRPDYVPAAYVEHKPLGLRYTILKLAGQQMVEVPADTVFHAGDRIQVSVEANEAGYLYIVQQGSSGTWKTMFPSPEIEGGDNRVEAGKTYVMPPKSRFIFDEQPGVEKLFLVLSRQPEPDLDEMIYHLRDRKKPTATEPPPSVGGQSVMVASIGPIGNAMVDRMRNLYSRDLVIEKVDEDTPGPRKETAVYVVNPAGSPDARVVADIRLNHQ